MAGNLLIAAGLRKLARMSATCVGVTGVMNHVADAAQPGTAVCVPLVGCMTLLETSATTWRLDVHAFSAKQQPLEIQAAVAARADPAPAETFLARSASLTALVGELVAQEIIRRARMFDDMDGLRGEAAAVADGITESVRAQVAAYGVVVDRVTLSGVGVPENAREIATILREAADMLAGTGVSPANLMAWILKQDEFAVRRAFAGGNTRVIMFDGAAPDPLARAAVLHAEMPPS